MDAVELLRQQASTAHEYLEGTMADVTAEQADWMPPGQANPIGASYAHAVFSEDMFVNGLLRGGTPLFAGEWQDKTGQSVLHPQEDWAQYAPWTRNVHLDLDAARAYAQAVYAATDEYLGGLTAADLDRKLDMSSMGMGETTVGWLLSNFVICHYPRYDGRDFLLEGATGNARLSLLIAGISRLEYKSGITGAKSHKRREIRYMSQPHDEHAHDVHHPSPSHAHHTHGQGEAGAPAPGHNTGLDAQVQQLEGMSEDQLLQVVGTYALSQQAAEMSGGLESMPSLADVVNLGRQFLQNPVILEAVCGHGGFQQIVENPTTSVVVSAIAGALGFGPGTQVPAAVVAAGWIIVRAGVRVYQGLHAPRPGGGRGRPGPVIVGLHKTCRIPPDCGIIIAWCPPCIRGSFGLS